MKKLNTIKHNKEEWQYEFRTPTFKLSIKDKDIKDKNIKICVTKQWADDAINKIGDGWKLPKDVDYVRAKRMQLDPKISEYDQMVFHMPWEIDHEKIENFKLLTGMAGWYRTSHEYYDYSMGYLIRAFDEEDRHRNRIIGIAGFNARPVRDLP